MVTRIAYSHWLGVSLYFKELSRSRLDLALTLISPLLLVLIAYWLHDDSTSGVGTFSFGLVGMWSIVLGGCTTALVRHRYEGTLPFLVAAPASLTRVLAQYAVATCATAVYALITTTAFEVIALDAPMSVQRPVAFLVSLVAFICGLAMFGVLLSTAAALARNPFVALNVLGYPIILAAGLVIPVVVLPAWVDPVSDCCVMTWGVRALQASVSGHGRVMHPLIVGLGVTMLYGAAVGCLGVIIDRRARLTGSLDLQ